LIPLLKSDDFAICPFISLFMKRQRWAAFRVLRSTGEYVTHELDGNGRLLVRPPKNKRRPVPYPNSDGAAFAPAALARPAKLVLPELPGTQRQPLAAEADVPTARPSTTGSSGPYAEQRQSELLPVNSDLMIEEEEYVFAEEEYLFW
jgi:hypothetical protein